MREAARIQTSIDVLQGYHSNLGPFDRYISLYFRKHRFVGSSDRRYIQELCFEVLRYYFILNHNIENRYEIIVLRYLIYVKRYNLDLLRDLQYDCSLNYGFNLSLDDETLISCDISKYEGKSGLPYFLECYLKDHYTFDNLQYLMHQAPCDIRVNLLQNTREQLKNNFEIQNILSEKTPLSHCGLRLKKRIKLDKNPYFSIQDEGSQLLCQWVDPKPGERVLDYCAGAGGKSLALADLSYDQAIIHAYDINVKFLSELRRRARLGHVHSITCIKEDILNNSANLYDKVIIDVPCSGTGTLRRSPERKFWLNEQLIDNFCLTQQKILRQSAQHVRVGGYLFYFTCSILPCENQHQIEKFLNTHLAFSTIHPHSFIPKTDASLMDHDAFGVTLTPWKTATDGFYCAVMQRLN